MDWISKLRLDISYFNQNDKLKEVYSKRLEEVEYAYSTLVDHFENSNSDKEPLQSNVVPPNTIAPNPILSNPVPLNPTPTYTNFYVEPLPTSKKKNKFVIIGALSVVILIGISLLYFKTSLFKSGNDDLFRVIEG